MTNRDFEIIYKRLCHDVANLQLNAAFNHMKELANECQNPYAQSQCEEIEETYLNLLKYAVDRYDDPERDNIFNKIQIQLLELADDLRNSHFTKNSNNIVYQYKRSTDTNVAASRSDGSFLRNYFMELFLSDKYSAVQTEQCIETISAPDIRENYKCTLVSAVMLGLIRTFDEAKLHLLLDFFNLPSKAIRQRALVALVFAASIYSQRIPIYKKLIF